MEFSSVISIILFHNGIIHKNFVAMKYRWKMSVFCFDTFYNGHLLSQLQNLINLQIRSLLISVNGTNCFANECSMSLCYLRTINYLQIGRERWETIHYLYILLIGKQVAVIDSECHGLEERNGLMLYVIKLQGWYGSVVLVTVGIWMWHCGSYVSISPSMWHIGWQMCLAMGDTLQTLPSLWASIFACKYL